jgi:hypothetical protein
VGVCWCPFLALESFSSCLPHHIYLLLLLLLSRARREKNSHFSGRRTQEKEIPCYKYCASYSKLHSTTSCREKNSHFSGRRTQEKENPCYTLLRLVVSSIVLHLVGKITPISPDTGHRKRKKAP